MAATARLRCQHELTVVLQWDVDPGLVLYRWRISWITASERSSRLPKHVQRSSSFNFGWKSLVKLHGEMFPTCNQWTNWWLVAQHTGLHYCVILICHFQFFGPKFSNLWVQHWTNKFLVVFSSHGNTIYYLISCINTTFIYAKIVIFFTLNCGR